MDGQLRDPEPRWLGSDDEPKERLFDPSRYATSPALQRFVAEQTERILAYELASGSRVRQRKAKDLERFKQAVMATICDLIHAELSEPSSWRFVSFSKQLLGRAGHGPEFISETFPTIVRRMAESSIGLVELRLGTYSSLRGRRSTIRAGHELRASITARGIHFGDLGCDLALWGDPIRLRGPKGNGRKRGDLLPPPPGEPADGFRREVDRINHWYLQAEISCEVLGRGKPLDLSRRFLRRHFNNGRMDHGGRFFGAFWMDVKAEDRLRYLRIGGERVVGLDFDQCGIRIAYGHVGAPVPSGDLYSVEGLNGDREGVKKVLNALLHASKAVSRFPRDSRPHFNDGLGFHQALRGIAARHAPIANLFGQGFGMTGFFIESQVIARSLLDLMEMGIVALPVHDCVLVPRSAAWVAEEVLLKAFREITGAEGAVTMEHDKGITVPRPLSNPTPPPWHTCGNP